MRFNKLRTCGGLTEKIQRDSATTSTQGLANMDGPMTVGRAGWINPFGFFIAGVPPSQRNCVDAPDDGAAGKRNLSLKLSERVSPVPDFAGALFLLWLAFFFLFFTVV